MQCSANAPPKQAARRCQPAKKNWARSNNFCLLCAVFLHKLAGLSKQHIYVGKCHKMTVALILYPKPDSVEIFNNHYHKNHAPLVKKIPGLVSLKVSRNPITTVAGKEKYFMAIELEFRNDKEMELALQSPEAQAAGADLVNFAPAGRVRYTYQRRSLMPSSGH